MIDILIKSFNRPHYLDRCLASIYQNVAGDYRISVLDDGTPEKYLDKIHKKYPEIAFIKSPNYNNKIKAIEENLLYGKEINGFQIPTGMWIDAVKNASEYFIITEEDVWFTEKINLNSLVNSFEQNDINLLKLGWLGNVQDDQHLKFLEIDDTVVATIPQDLFLGNEKIMDAFFYNRYKFFTILYKLGRVDNHTRLKYWALNSILMGMYKKEYWLQIWKKMNEKLDEKRQLVNASSYYSKNKNNPAFISRLKKEAMKTTFQSSATNSYHKYGNDFDVNQFNHQINEAWYNGDFDAMQDYPQDFSLDYFEQFLNEKINITEWRKWVENFKNHYREIGCNVEN